MSKPNRKSFNLQKIVDQAEEAVGAEVEFTWNGKPYTFPNPHLADDAFKRRYLDAGGEEATYRVLLGDEQYEKFLADGGRASYLTLVMSEVNKQYQGYLADGSPTQSSTS